MPFESIDTVELRLLRSDVPVFQRHRRGAFERCTLTVGERLVIGRLPDCDVVVPGDEALHLGGRRSYLLERTGDGSCRLQHTGHIGQVQIGSTRLTGSGRFSCEVPLGEEITFFSATGPPMLVLRLEPIR